MKKIVRFIWLAGLILLFFFAAGWVVRATYAASCDQLTVERVSMEDESVIHVVQDEERPIYLAQSWYPEEVKCCCKATGRICCWMERVTGVGEPCNGPYRGGCMCDR